MERIKWFDERTCPPWLRVKGQVRGPRAQDVAGRFVAFVESMFERTSEPDEVWITFGAQGRSLAITIRIMPASAFHAERTVLERVAQEFEQMLRSEPDETSSDGEREEPLDLIVASIPEAFDCAEDPPEGSVRVFRCDLASFEDGGRALGRDAEVASRNKRVLERLSATGLDRRLIQPPLVWQTMLDGLSADFPAFEAVIQDVVRPHLALCAMGIQHRLPPILLVGPPGVGKTYFASALARVLGVEAPLFVPMSAESNGATLAGSSTFWANSAPGALFELLAWGRGGQDACANPIVVLDELDKSNADRYSPLGALYSLLERNTASRFQDQALPDVTIDASHVRFLATANEVDAIPEPLQSRLTIFTIQPLSNEQQLALTRSVFRSVMIDLRLAGRVAAEEGFYEAARGGSAREIRMRMEAAVAFALSEGRYTLCARDWHRVQKRGDHRRPIGFCP